MERVGGRHRNLSGDNYYKKMFRIGKRDLAIQILLESRGALSQAGWPVRGKTGTGTQDS